MGKITPVTEALVEMYFFAPLVDLFSSHFGANVVEIIKPSPNREVFLGFDQGWVRSEYKISELENNIADAIKNRSPCIDKFYIGYFMQFKTVERMVKRSKSCPESVWTPYYRSEIDLKRNKRTRLSQHETLLRLKNMMKTDVNYACGMLFSPSDIYKKADLDLLPIVPIKGGLSEWNEGDRHYIICKRSRGSLTFLPTGS